MLLPKLLSLRFSSLQGCQNQFCINVSVFFYHPLWRFKVQRWRIPHFCAPEKKFPRFPTSLQLGIAENIC